MDTITKVHFMTILYVQRQIQNFLKGGGVGYLGYGYFILCYFVLGTYHTVRGQNAGRQNTSEQAPVKITRDDKLLKILWEREGKMPIV